MRNRDNSLEVLQPLGEDVILYVDGKAVTVNVQEFMLGDIGFVTSIIGELGIEISSISRDDVGFAMKIFSQNVEKVFQVLRMSIASELERLGIIDQDEQIKWIKSLRGRDGVKLVVSIVKVNYDFFSQSKELVLSTFPDLMSEDVEAQETTNSMQEEETTDDE